MNRGKSEAEGTLKTFLFKFHVNGKVFPTVDILYKYRAMQFELDIQLNGEFITFEMNRELYARSMPNRCYL